MRSVNRHDDLASRRVSATAQAFSKSAQSYDADEQGNRVARWTRAQNLAYLYSTFRPSQLILDVGCGTGTEAISLAKGGLHIVATDSAPGMISQLQAKAAVLGAGETRERIMALVLPAAHLGELTRQYGHSSFDGAYSSFGPLNCEPELATVSSALGGLIRPGGKVVISVLGRFCVWETAWYLLHGELRQAFRRWGGRAEATVRGAWQDERISVFYWSADHVERSFAADFTLVQRTALPWILPPQYLSGIFKSRMRLFRLLTAVENRTANYWPANVIGDHIRFTFMRKR